VTGVNNEIRNKIQQQGIGKSGKGDTEVIVDGRVEIMKRRVVIFRRITDWRIEVFLYLIVLVLKSIINKFINRCYIVNKTI
jgi:hypothetical protein